MLIRKQGPLFYSCIFLLIIVQSGCFKNLTQTTIAYENDFNNGDPGYLYASGWNSTGTAFKAFTDKRVSYFNGEQMMGKLNNASVQMAFELPPHELLRVEFDLYLHDKWQNDLFRYTINGADQLVAGFSNIDNINQSYPNWLGNGTPQGPAGRNAEDRDLPGACSLASAAHGTSKYHIVSTLYDKNTKFSFAASDAGGFFNDTCQRSWSIDNFKISLISNK